MADRKKPTVKGHRAESKSADNLIEQLTKAIAANKKEASEELLVGDSFSLFKDEGMDVHSVQRNVTSDYEGKRWEIGGVVVGKKLAIVIKTKATLRKEDITTFINTILANFTKLEPDHEGKKIYGAMGFLNADDEVQALAQEQGLVLIRPTDVYTELVPSPKGFRLRNFHP